MDDGGSTRLPALRWGAGGASPHPQFIGTARSADFSGLGAKAVLQIGNSQLREYGALGTEQIEQIRKSANSAGIRRAIRAREVKRKGCLNPNLSDDGVSPENRQSSGRKVEQHWCHPMVSTERSRLTTRA